jgi:site-specific DNA recombinase
MAEGGAAFYARVSSKAQAREHTIDSQVAALRERIAADGGKIAPDNGYVDEGQSGASLVRRALERLRDAVTVGAIERLYVLAPGSSGPTARASSPAHGGVSTRRCLGDLPQSPDWSQP